MSLCPTWYRRSLPTLDRRIILLLWNPKTITKQSMCSTWDAAWTRGGRRLFTKGFWFLLKLGNSLPDFVFELQTSLCLAFSLKALSPGFYVQICSKFFLFFSTVQGEWGIRKGNYLELALSNDTSAHLVDQTEHKAVRKCGRLYRRTARAALLQRIVRRSIWQL